MSTNDFSDIRNSLATLERKMIEGAIEGMGDAVDELLRDSLELAPLDKRTLRDSAKGNVSGENGDVVGTVTYSATELDARGNRVNYALITHELGSSENMSAFAFKNPSTPGTRPKYLERPLYNNAERYKQKMSDGVRRRLS